MHKAAQLVANSSGDVLHRARAIKEHGKTRVFEGIEDICTLFTEAFSSYLQELAKYGIPEQLDVDKTAVVPDAAGLCDNASDCMRSSAKSKALLSRVVTEKVQAIRSVPLLGLPPYAFFCPRRSRDCASMGEEMEQALARRRK